MKKMLIPAMIVAVVITCAAVAAAQTTGPGKPPSSGTEPSEERREEVRKKIEAVRIWRLTEALKLDAPTSSKLSALLSSFDQQRKDIVRGQMTTMRELRRMLEAPKPDDAKIRIAVDKLEKDQHALQALREKEFSAVKQILTIEQQARFLLFQQTFRREMQGMIANARKGGPGPHGGTRGEGPGSPPSR